MWGPSGVDCGRSFVLMDLSFPGKRSHCLSVCLSPALLLNQGEWSYLLALTREGDTGGGVSGEGHGLKLPSRSGVRQVEDEIKVDLGLGEAWNWP